MLRICFKILFLTASKHIILICNCRPYGLPAIESVGIDGNFKGQTAEQLAALMIERNIHLTILAPRKIPGKSK